LQAWYIYELPDVWCLYGQGDGYCVHLDWHHIVNLTERFGECFCGLYCIVLYCNVLYCNVLYCIVL
jgi:hypothetical protein